MSVRKLLAILVSVACTVSAFGQGWYIGPDVGFTLSTSVPSEVSNSGAPTRFRVGALAFAPTGKKVDVKLMVGYKLESGSFAMPYSSQNVVENHAPSNRLHVGEPDPNAPKVRSDLSSSTIDLGAELFFPLGDLDTSGSKIGFSVGAYADRMLSATQTDDYSAVESYPGDKLVTYNYEGQFGFGAMLGIGMYIPMGSGRLVFDIKYVVRQPTTITTTTEPPVEQNVGWMMGPGIRMNLAYLFRL